MSADKDKQSKIKFGHEWYYCCLPLVDTNINIHDITNSNNNDDYQWSPIQLPHTIINDEESNDTIDKKQYNWWYRKQFEWKTCPNDSDYRFYLSFESLNDESSVNTFTVWLNETEIFSNSFHSPNVSIDLTEQIIYTNDSEDNDRKNTLLVCCNNVALALHVFLVLPYDIHYAIEQKNTEIDDNKKMTITLPCRKNRVLDYLVNFNDITVTEENIEVEKKKKTYFKLSSKEHDIFNYLVSSNNIDINNNSKQSNLPDIVVSEYHDQSNKEKIKELHVPRLTIVMLIVGTRGDVQPFIAFGQTLCAAGHRVRLATHEKFRKYVREHDLEFYPLASNPEDLMSFMVKNGGIVPSLNSLMQGDLKKKRDDVSKILRSTWLACTENDDETSAPFTAEVIIANPPSFGHIHCAQKLQIPLHIMFTMPWSPTTEFAHAFCKIDHSKEPKEKLNLISYDLIETLTWSSLRDLVNAFRRDTLGLPPVHKRQAIRMLIDEQVPHTYCWSPSLVPAPHDWPHYINVSGFFFLNNNNDQFKPSDDLAAFLGLNNDNENKEKLSPPIYIGFGSVTGNNSDHLLQVILDALEETGYRAILSGFEDNDEELPENILKISDVPHDWLFQHVSAVCHHGGAGTVAAGLRAGKPNIVVPFFGDQFFWGSIVEKCGAGPTPLPGKRITAKKLAEALTAAHEPAVQSAAERISKAISGEDGCATALRMFHTHLPLSRMHSDLESTFVACYRIDEYDLQVSRPVAQVLIATGALDESRFSSHPTREWTYIYDHRMHVPTGGIFKHTHKALSHIFVHSASGMRRAVSSGNLLTGVVTGVAGVCKNMGKGVGSLSVGVLSLYGELTDVLDRAPSLYDPYSELDAHERPRVTDFKSGARAAGQSVAYGWKDGVTGFVRKPRIGYRRHGILGGATGLFVATVNGVVKPTSGSLASVTWLSRGMYASMKKKRRSTSTDEKQTLINKISVQSSSDGDDDDDVPKNIKFASVVSGYSTEICQHILDEFNKIKKRYEENDTSSQNQADNKHYPKQKCRQSRRDSDSAL
ncbi:unnamed protein product [Adineta steineri]|uniref:Uncharacterized protein n=2 Tax=Adineta steineri TaxID=433720 RepID=A0A818P7A2_9BILA|nr:unnamed protein product [Adineta steineri]CAF3614884.1 unnamed protein product [Adineta steineri]CAF3679462.1 unnamed protein product [Adineta steineri]